jgi:lincosamide nucleotidyltransferase A/C/D/E
MNLPVPGGESLIFPSVRLRFVRRAYRLIAATPLRPVLRSRLAQRMKNRLVEMPVEVVVDVLDKLEQAGVPVWLAGGWGVDALLGEQTRPHRDLDLVFDADSDGERRAIVALEALGFQVMGREPVRTHWWSERIALSDDRGHVVDLHPVSGSEFTTALQAHSKTPFVTGKVAGRPVACFSQSVQLRLHEGYDDATDVDRADVALLRGRVRDSR